MLLAAKDLSKFTLYAELTKPAMKVGLFIPCYIDQFYPEVGVATLGILEGLGIDVVYPQAQTCCGQPMANAGFEQLSDAVFSNFLRCFDKYDSIVAPSGSCVLHVREHLAHTHGMANRIFELTEFLTDVMKVGQVSARFPHRVGLHQSCHGQRGLGLAQMSEIVGPPFSKTETLLRMVSGLELIQPARRDECCGFGGTFAVSEEAVSVKMGKDRIADHIANGVEYITGNDMSCLMHLEGIIRRQKLDIKVIHVANILHSGT